MQSREYVKNMLYTTCIYLLYSVLHTILIYKYTQIPYSCLILTVVCRFVLTHVAGTAQGLEASNSLEAVRQTGRGSSDLTGDGRSKLVHPDVYDQITKTLKWHWVQNLKPLKKTQQTPWLHGCTHPLW